MNKPELHFAHANGLPSACYGKLFDALANDVDVQALPILGMDPRFPVRRHWHELADQVADSIRTRCKGPVIGLGHSMGGLCTFFAAHRYPELFRGVVILDPPVINGPGALAFSAMRWMGQVDRITPAGRSKGRREVWPSRDVARELLRPKGLFRTFDEDCFEDYLRYGLSDCEQGVCLTIPAAVEVDIFRTTPTDSWRYRRPLAVPGVLLTGSKSDFKGSGFAERLARTQGLLHREVQGGHMFPLEHPLQTVEAILAGLRTKGLLA
ncbi:MAG: alpha/beta hydrolase [Moraxellaceae bacterium]|nr:alpha/beta hydrolase [Moraxellaceae bacterium]